jgi:hypothetical protein
MAIFLYVASNQKKLRPVDYKFFPPENTGVSNLVGLQKDFTTERTEITEKISLKNLCGLRVLCGKTLFSPSF